MNYSVVIPVYKSASSLQEIVKQFKVLQQNHKLKFEIIFVNDSPFYEETSKVLSSLSSINDFVKVITLRKNQGQHLALIVGLSYAKGEYVITMDDDLQHPVSEIPKLIDAMIENPNLDAVFAIPPFERRKHHFWRNFGSFLIAKLDNFFLKKPKGLVKSSFRIFKKSIAESIVSNYNAMPSVSSLIIFYTHSIKNISVEHHKRAYGKSNYTLRKLMSLTLNNYINFSSLPLKIMGFIGFIAFFVTILFVLFTVIRKIFFGLSYPGYTSIIALTGLLGGLNLLTLGFIGEYLLRIIKGIQKPGIRDMVSSES
ncbi:MAG TPA: glycosyltransferase [Bacteroidales bacterium]|nr:glycosyltransferase [Bacteroidales bacterium]